LADCTTTQQRLSTKMTSVPEDHALLQQLETYLDAVPRSAARVEPRGALTLFCKVGAGWPYYARPTPGWPEPVTADDVAAVRQRQRELELPESFEWVQETTPSMWPAAKDAGLHVLALPLMVLDAALSATVPEGLRVRLLTADDADLAAPTAVADVAFTAGGTGVGPAGVAERDAAAGALGEDRLSLLRDRIRRGLTFSAMAEEPGVGPLCVGSHQPVGEVTEIVGVGTLPEARRRGLAAAVTAALVEHAGRLGVSTVFLSAGSDDVARMYAGVGFVRVGTSCLAEPPGA